MARPRRPKPTARLRLEGLECRKLLSTAAEMASVATPAAEVGSTTASTADPTTQDPTTAGVDPMIYATSGGVQRGTRSAAELRGALLRAQRRAARWEQADAAGPRIVDTTLLTRGDQVVGFALRFDSPMRADAAVDPNAYRAIRITQPNKWLARVTYQGDGPQVEDLGIRSVEYRAEDQTAVVWLRDPRKATGKFRVGVVTHESPGQRRGRPLALGPLTDTSGHIVRHNPADVKLPGRNVLFTQPDHSAPYDAPRFRNT